MREISLHILDILQNSIAAGSTRIEVVVEADSKKDLLKVSIRDNGRGMSPEMVQKVASPFFTTRRTRNVGLGLPMFRAAAEMCDGGLKLSSKEGEGTLVEAEFKLSHIDRAPLGDITGTMVTAIIANPEISFKYEQIVDGKPFILDTDDIRRVLGDEVSIQSAPVIKWLRAYITQGIEQVGAIP